MKTEKQIREIISHDDNIVKLLKIRPETYKSILQSCCGPGTYDQILRRRIKRLFNEGRIWKLRVPGTRFGLCIFCDPNPDYKILTSQTMTGVRIFYMYEYEENNKYVILNKRWELDSEWIYWKKFEDELKIPKFSLRDGGFRIWE